MSRPSTTVLALFVALALSTGCRGPSDDARLVDSWTRQTALARLPADAVVRVAGGWSGELHPCECAAGMDGGIARAATVWREPGSVAIAVGPLLSPDEAFRPAERTCLDAVLRDVGAAGAGLAAGDGDGLVAGGAPGPLVVEATRGSAEPFVALRSDEGRTFAWTHVAAGGHSLAGLRGVVGFLRERADYVLVTSDAQSGGLVDVLRAAAGADLVVTSGRAGETAVPVDREGVAVIALGEGGRDVVEVRLGARTVRRRALHRGVSVDPVAWRHVETAFRAHARLGAARIDESSRYADLADDCGECHPRETARWAKTAHAHAWESLPEHRRGDPRCAACHSTPVRSGGGTARLVPDIGCSTCHDVPVRGTHGPVTSSVNAGLCVTCHDERNSPGFDTTAGWAAIRCDSTAPHDREDGR